MSVEIESVEMAVENLDPADYAFDPETPIKVWYSEDEFFAEHESLIYQGPLSGWFGTLNADCDGVEFQTDHTEAEIVSLLSTYGSMVLGGGAAPEVTVEVVSKSGKDN